MLTLFTIPDSANMIASSSAVVSAWTPEFLPVIYLSLAITVVVGSILFLSRKLSGGAKGILGGRRRRRARRR